MVIRYRDAQGTLCESLFVIVFSQDSVNPAYTYCPSLTTLLVEVIYAQTIFRIQTDVY